jgi:hypothetical protein
LERRFDLDADEVVRIVEPSSLHAIGDAKPVSPYEGEQDITPGHSLSNCFSKVRAKGNRVNVHEDIIFAETVTKTIIETASVCRCFFPPVADEDAATVPT